MAYHTCGTHGLIDCQRCTGWCDHAPEMNAMRSALVDCALTLEHALELGFLGEGSTRTMAMFAVRKAQGVLGTEPL